MGKYNIFVWPLWWDITMSRNDGHILPLWWDIWPSLRDIAPIYYPCDGTYDHHYWTFYILLPLWWDIWPSLLDILHFISLVMGHMTIITGHCTFYYPCDGTNDYHYGTLHLFITLVMGHMTIITGHFVFYYPCDGTNDHHYGTLHPFITLVMGQMTIIMGHCTLLFPLWCDIWPSLRDNVYFTAHFTSVMLLWRVRQIHANVHEHIAVCMFDISNAACKNVTTYMVYGELRNQWQIIISVELLVLYMTINVTYIKLTMMNLP